LRLPMRAEPAKCVSVAQSPIPLKHFTDWLIGSALEEDCIFALKWADVNIRTAPMNEPTPPRMPWI
jgi:hypothetical protein